MHDRAKHPRRLNYRVVVIDTSSPRPREIGQLSWKHLCTVPRVPSFDQEYDGTPTRATQTHRTTSNFRPTRGQSSRSPQLKGARPLYSTSNLYRCGKAEFSLTWSVRIAFSTGRAHALTSIFSTCCALGPLGQPLRWKLSFCAAGLAARAHTASLQVILLEQSCIRT